MSHVVISWIMRFLPPRRRRTEVCRIEIKDGLERIAAADFSYRFSPSGPEKLSICQQTFNLVMDEVEKVWRQGKEQNEILESLLSEVEEALVLIDEGGKIIACNRVFRHLVDPIKPEGKYLDEVIRSTSFHEFFRRLKDQKEVAVAKAEIQLGEKIYLVKLISMAEGKRSALIMRDISREKNLETIKKEMVANISHELRTPLTSIKGYLETLEEEELNEKARSYLRPLKNNVDRLERIVADLLTLSALESREDVLDKEVVNLMEVINRVIDQTESAARRKGLLLQVEAESDVPPVYGDRFRLEQMLLNLVDNALKYTDRGSVKIRLSKGENEIIVEVEDTGIGIPPSHLDRIFERFYVVDKSRARRLGGTGLGLSIVKHIVLLHGGKINVKSREGIGTTFTISLPEK